MTTATYEQVEVLDSFVEEACQTTHKKDKVGMLQSFYQIPHDKKEALQAIKMEERKLEDAIEDMGCRLLDIDSTRISKRRYKRNLAKHNRRVLKRYNLN